MCKTGFVGKENAKAWECWADV